MSTFGDCVKRDVCIYAKEDICNDCGHYISDRKFTSTKQTHNSKSMPCNNPLHNIQVEADGRCHWCESKVKQ